MARTEPRAREPFRERLIYFGYRAAESIISALPRRLTLLAAAALGNLAYDVAPAKAQLVRENLSRPMRRAPDDPAVARAARRAFRNYGRYLVDVMRIGALTAREIERLVRLRDVDLLKRASAEGKGVLLCTVHVGGMDILGAGLALHGESIHVVADDTTYGRLYDHLAAERAKHHIYLIGWRNLRRLFRALQAGQNLVLFCDGGYRPGDVPVELCGEVTTFPAGPAVLAARSGAPMLPVACRRTADDRFEAHALPIVHVTDESPASVQRATQEIANSLGSVIAADPGQWYMFRPVWPQTDADRARASAALEAARRGEDWARTAA